MSVDAVVVSPPESEGTLLRGLRGPWEAWDTAAGRRGAIATVAVVGAFVRCWQLGSVGFNSDEAVYAGQAASIAGQTDYLPYFPIFRAHPLLFQSLLSLFYHFSVSDVGGRLLAAAFGVGTLFVVYALGKVLYGFPAGLVAMVLLAVMPYHVTVTRQVLLDGPMVFFATGALYLLVRYCRGHGDKWLVAATGVLGLAVLTKETAMILVAGVYCFFMLTHSVKVRLSLAVGCLALLGAVVSAFPVALRLAGASRSGGNYLAWQLFRRANHGVGFYVSHVPVAMGLVVIVVGLVGLLVDRDGLDWREGLLAAWALIPITFFTLMPIKGFQYLLPIAPVAAVLAARSLTSSRVWAHVNRRASRWRIGRRPPWTARHLQAGMLALAVLSLMIPCWNSIQPSTRPAFLAGSGGLPGGRQAGAWVRGNLPVGSTFLTLGPSMANIVAFYGHRQAYGLSVSPNPLNRNPSYTAIDNADLQLRSGAIQYAVWDSFSAGRSPSFSAKLLAYVNKYHGVAIHTETVPVDDASGTPISQPVITIYELRP